eukprot:2999286-Amphidinium_carterae.1
MTGACHVSGYASVPYAAHPTQLVTHQHASDVSNQSPEGPKHVVVLKQFNRLQGCECVLPSSQQTRFAL